MFFLVIGEKKIYDSPEAIPGFNTDLLKQGEVLVCRMGWGARALLQYLQEYGWESQKFLEEKKFYAVDEEDLPCIIKSIKYSNLIADVMAKYNYLIVALDALRSALPQEEVVEHPGRGMDNCPFYTMANIRGEKGKEAHWARVGAHWDISRLLACTEFNLEKWNCPICGDLHFV